MSIFTDNAATFATTPDIAVEGERHRAVRHAITLILDGRPGRAQYELARSVIRQARYAGLGTVDVPICACGGRCKPTP